MLSPNDAPGVSDADKCNPLKPPLIGIILHSHRVVGAQYGPEPLDCNYLTRVAEHQARLLTPIVPRSLITRERIKQYVQRNGFVHSKAFTTTGTPCVESPLVVDNDTETRKQWQLHLHLHHNIYMESMILLDSVILSIGDLSKSNIMLN